MEIEYLVNKYIEYYKKTYPDKNIKNMFDGIDFSDDKSTNHIMEMFYTDLLKYKNLDNKIYLQSDINNIDISNYEEFFMLKNGEKNCCFSESVITLLIEVLNNDYNDWYIINMK